MAETQTTKTPDSDRSKGTVKSKREDDQLRLRKASRVDSVGQDVLRKRLVGSHPPLRTIRDIVDEHPERKGVLTLETPVP